MTLNLIFGMVCLASLSPLFAEPKSQREVNSHLAGKIDPPRESEKDRLFIYLHLSPFQKIEAVNQKGEKIVKFHHQAGMKHYLKTQLNKDNHFFLGNYHIVITPKNDPKVFPQVRYTLEFMQRFGDYGQVEQKLGSLDVDGTAEITKKQLIFYGKKTHRFLNQWGHPELEVVIGNDKQNSSHDSHF